MKQNNKEKPNVVGCLGMIILGLLVTIILNAAVRESSGNTYVGKFVANGIVKTFMIYAILCIVFTFFFKD